MTRARTTRRAAARLVGGLSALALLGLGSGETLAAWTDAKSVPGVTVQTGRVDVLVNGADSITGFAGLSQDWWTPGTVRAASLTVRNNGNLPAAYSVGFAGSNSAVHGALERSVVVGGTPSGTGCSGGTPVGGAPLAPGASESICVEVRLKSNAETSVAGRTSDLGITVTGSTTAGHWSDPVPVNGTRIATPAIKAPTIACSAPVLGQVTVSWGEVPGATGYRLYVAGLQVGDDLGSTARSVQIPTPLGLVKMRALFGSGTWESDLSAAC
ncbi:SipW-dependent-type signal peptide-containing protein [Nocardioides sp. GCM10027113]|uniref:SipW-dependent-type signal peptide-containing protein n=1 Tax=unclassified Nocardioides TaxID=2615069 RepID=UPI00361D6835